VPKRNLNCSLIKARKGVTMEKEKSPRTQTAQEEQGAAASLSPSKKPWQEPKLAFVEPKLTKHGELEQVTFGFSGRFDPSNS
jgi:hypothetical protein